MAATRPALAVVRCRHRTDRQHSDHMGRRADPPAGCRAAAEPRTCPPRRSVLDSPVTLPRLIPGEPGWCLRSGVHDAPARVDPLEQDLESVLEPLVRGRQRAVPQRRRHPRAVPRGEGGAGLNEPRAFTRLTGLRQHQRRRPADQRGRREHRGHAVEAVGGQEGEHTLERDQGVGSHADPTADDRRDPRVREEHPAHRASEGRHPLLPRVGRHEPGQDLADDAIGHEIEQVVLAFHVPVDRRRPGVQLRPQVAHGERVRPVLVEDADRGVNDLVAGKGHLSGNPGR